MAQWKKSERSDSVRFWIYQCKTETDCFNVIAQNESVDVIGTFAVKFAEDSLLKKVNKRSGYRRPKIMHLHFLYTKNADS